MVVRDLAFENDAVYPSSVTMQKARLAPSVSVVIPCFNCSDTIADCLASIRQQTYAVLEIIVVDDGSTDDSWQRLHQLRSTSYPNLRILCHEHHQNYGASLTRSVGIAAAKAEYIALLDSDDLFEPRKLEKQLQAFSRFPDLVLCHTAVRVIGDRDQAAYFEAAFSGSPREPYRYRKQRDYLIRNRICNSSVVAKAAILKCIPCSFLGRDSVEDWLCWCLLAAKGDFLFLDHPLTTYRVHGTSKTSALTHGGDVSLSIAQQTSKKLRQLYVNLEFKLVLLARSESSLHGLRVLGSIGEDLRLIVISYLWNPGCEPNSTAMIKPSLLVKLLMVPFRIGRSVASLIGAPWFRR